MYEISNFLVFFIYFFNIIVQLFNCKKGDYFFILIFFLLVNFESFESLMLGIV